ncbi:MAG TPA: TraR/DksA C4-type zinc finger protein [Ruminiclostridium sp.]|nr:TraR/DksA C4-type zinc finger protein [Ruminiclostridium sp.]
MEKNQLLHYKDMLLGEAKRADRTLEQMRDLEEGEMSNYTPSELSNYDNHPADMGSELYTLEMNLALKVHEQTKLSDIKLALKKIDNGTYGICENCKKPIQPGRLEIMPAARFCMECQEDKEASEINTPDQQYDEVFDAPFGRKYLNQQEDDEFEGIDQLNDVLKYGSADSPQDMGGYADFEEYYTNEVDNQGYVEEIDKISNQQYKNQLP